jgi:hypothetical protein
MQVQYVSTLITNANQPAHYFVMIITTLFLMCVAIKFCVVVHGKIPETFLNYFLPFPPYIKYTIKEGNMKKDAMHVSVWTPRETITVACFIE